MTLYEIPDSILLAAMSISILLACTSWGRKKAERK